MKIDFMKRTWRRFDNRQFAGSIKSRAKQCFARLFQPAFQSYRMSLLIIILFSPAIIEFFFQKHIELPPANVLI